jgi:2-isopropylmalate synthase
MVQEEPYDWNAPVNGLWVNRGVASLLDETLRDGLQNPSGFDPPIREKLALLYQMEQLGIDVANLGLPAASRRQFDDVLAACTEIRNGGLRIQAAAAGRTVPADLELIAEISQRAGIAVEAYTFIGSSPIRQLAEDWDITTILHRSAAAIDFAVRHGLGVCYVTEDTTRSRPDVLETLFRNAVDHGAGAICLADTVGHATPDGVRSLVAFTRDVLRRAGATHVRIDWHGHNDRGLALQNALWALEAGAVRVHATALGIGERVGNVPMELLLLNLAELGGWNGFPRGALRSYCESAAHALKWVLPPNHPLRLATA